MDLTGDKKSGEVKLLIDDTLKIVLDANPTTGFTWQIVNQA